MPRFKGKNVAVIGATSGIGLACAKAFVREGARVLLTGRDSQALQTLQQNIGDRAVVYPSDVRHIQEIAAVFADAAKTFDKLDILLVNAGVGAQLPIESVTEADWDNIQDTNLKGAFFSVQAALPLMHRDSAIVFMGSIAALRATAGFSVYAASKGGLRSLAQCLANELVPRGIRVNIVSPGPTATNIFSRAKGVSPDRVPSLLEEMAKHNPMKRMGTPEDVVGAVLFLASDESAFITGADLLVDGGTMRF